jgi:hypothetical protein
VTACQDCRGRGERVLPGSSAATVCAPCEGTGAAPAESATTFEYGAPAVPVYGPGGPDVRTIHTTTTDDQEVNR